MLTIEAYQTRMKEANKMNYYNTVGISQDIMYRYYILYIITYFISTSYFTLYIIPYNISFFIS